MAQFDTEIEMIKQAIESLVKQDEVTRDNNTLIIKDRLGCEDRSAVIMMQ